MEHENEVPVNVIPEGNDEIIGDADTDESLPAAPAVDWFLDAVSVTVSDESQGPSETEMDDWGQAFDAWRHGQAFNEAAVWRARLAERAAEVWRETLAGRAAMDAAMAVPALAEQNGEINEGIEEFEI
jgi:hypothetical protein